MNSLHNNYSLHVVVATVLASAMILITGNGVADAVKVTEEALVETLQEAPLPPPGPFGLMNSQAENPTTALQQPQKVLAPVAPKMPDIMQVIPKLNIAPPIALKPINKGIKQNVISSNARNAPVLNKLQQSISLATINAPVNHPQPVVPLMPAIIPPTTMNPPVARIMPQMPQLNHNLYPQQQVMPEFRANPRQLRAAPQIQMYRYIPLPVYQANFRHPQPPKFNAIAPSQWIPQEKNK